MKFDDILLEIGEFGPYQQKVFYLLCLPVLIGGAHTFCVIFTYDIPSYRCAVPEYPNDTYRIQNEAHLALINRMIPPAGDDDDGDYSGCNLYADDPDNVTSSAKGDNSTRLTRECTQWVYDRSDYHNTIVTEFDLICGKEIMRSHANMVSFASMLCASIFVGVVADVFGRKKAIWMGFVLEIIYSLMTYFAPNFNVIIGSRVIGGVASQALFAIIVTSGLELVGPSKRSFTGVVVELYWSAGVLLILPVAYLVREWRYIHLSMGIGTLPMLALWWIIPESPRWLLDKKRYKEVEVTLDKICKANNTKLPTGAISEDTNDEGPAMKIWAMFTNRVLVLRFVILFLNWFSVSLLYYGISLNTTNLHGSPYLNYLYSAAFELLAYLFLLVVMDRIGRRKLHSSCMLIGSLACLCVIPSIVYGADDWVNTVLTNIGKFCISCSYAILYVLSCELLPTTLRNSGIGVCAIFESVGGICSPYIADLGVILGGSMEDAIPMIVFGGASLIAGSLSLFLPETLHRKLPETIQDAIDFGKNPPEQDYVTVKSSHLTASVCHTLESEFGSHSENAIT